MTNTVLFPTDQDLHLHGRDFLKEIDFTTQEWQSLVSLVTTLKRDRYQVLRRGHLERRNIALIFEKASTRTRCAFEVAAYEEGANVTYLDPEGSHLGHKESIADTARVLSRMYDGIEYRGFDQRFIEELARNASIPVWNGLTDQWHPTQSLCDVFTMAEHSVKAPSAISVAYVGDARNNVANSLLIASAMMGMDIRMVAPHQLQTSGTVTARARMIAGETGARVRQTTSVDDGVAGVDYLYTDVWLSMGEPEDQWDERIEQLLPYRVDANLVDKANNPSVKFMHCLPALHDDRTEIGETLLAARGLNGLEVSNDVFESENSIVFDQAENRLHAIKAIMVATIGSRP